MKITKILINKMPVDIKYNVLTCNSSLHSLDHICSSMRKQLRQISCLWTVTNSHSYQRKLDHASLLCCDNKLYFAASLTETPKCTRCITLAMSPVEVFVTARFLISDCSFLEHLTIWFSVVPSSNCSCVYCILDSLIFAVQRSTWSLDWLSRTLIVWFISDPGHKRFNRGLT